MTSPNSAVRAILTKYRVRPRLLVVAGALFALWLLRAAIAVTIPQYPGWEERQLLKVRGTLWHLKEVTVARSVLGATCEARAGRSASDDGGLGHTGISVTTIIRNEARYAREWVAFHRAVGVAHFDLWDDGSDDRGELEAELAPYIASGAVTLRRINESLRHLKDEVVEPTLAARRAGTPGCAPTDDDLAELQRAGEDCAASRARGANFIPCQFFVIRVSGALAKLRQDAWLGVFDVDEFMYRPDVAAAAVSAGAPAPEVAASAPLLHGTGLRPALDAIARAHPLCMSVAVQGAMFGTSGYEKAGWKGLVSETHTLHAPYDGVGDPLPPPWEPRGSGCPPLLCDTARPVKSFMLVTDALAVRGLRVHDSDTGLVCWQPRVPSSPLFYNHISYYSSEEVYTKVVRNEYGTGSPLYAVARNVSGAEAYFNVQGDGDLALSRLAPLLHYCMDHKRAMTPECGGPRHGGGGGGGSTVVEPRRRRRKPKGRL